MISAAASRFARSLFYVTVLVGPQTAFADSDQTYNVGVASVDITPDYPIRLNGFGNRREESAGVSERIFARALAISQGSQPPLVLVTLDQPGNSFSDGGRGGAEACEIASTAAGKPGCHIYAFALHAQSERSV